MSKRTKNRNIIIIGLSSIVLLMAVGYAAFQTVLNIQGTSNISSTWDVQITGIVKDKTNGNATEISEPTFNKENATFSVGLESPSDYIYYKVAVTNKGSLAAIAKLGKLNCGESNVIECGAYSDSSVTNIGANSDLTSQRLIIGPNETEYYNIWIRYRDDVTEQPTSTSASITLELTYEQSDVGITHTTEDKCYTGKVLDNGTLTITDYDESCGVNVIIPETIDGYTVTEIQNGKWDANLAKTISAFAYKNIESVVIPDNITRIGSLAFYSNKISSVTIGNNVKEIATNAFRVNKLTEVILPDSVTILGRSSFANNLLKGVTIPSSVTSLGAGAFAYNNFDENHALMYGMKSDGTIDYTVLNSYTRRSATSVTIPDTVTKIDADCFFNVKIPSIEIPAKVTSIGVEAFNNSQLSSIVLNEGLKTIASTAFANNALTHIEIPNSVTSIGKDAFIKNKLQTVTIGSGTTYIGPNAFQTIGVYNPVTSITINREKDSISGSPWGASDATINWLNNK